MGRTGGSSGWRRPLALVALLVALGPTSCVDPEGATDDPIGPQTFGEGALVAAGDVLVPDAVPAGFTARLVRREGEDGGNPGDDVHLYADRAGRTVLVVLQEGDSQGAAVGPLLQGSVVSVGGHRAQVAEAADGWWVGWQPPSRSQEPGAISVYAESVDRARAIAIAEQVWVDPGYIEHRTVGLADPGSLGLVDVAHVRGLTIASLAVAGPPASASGIVWSPSDGDLPYGPPTVVLSAWKRDPAVSAILRAVVDGDGRSVRGAGGAGGGLNWPDEDEHLIRTWEEGAMTMAVVSTGLEAPRLDQFVDSLRPATEQDWAGIVAQATAPPAMTGTGISGGFPTGYWTLKLTAPPPDVPFRLWADVSVFGVEGSADGFGTILELPLWSEALHPDGVLLVVGVVDPATERVEIVFTDGTTMVPVLQRLDVGAGVQAFGQWRDEGVEVASVRSFDRSGNELARR